MDWRPHWETLNPPQKDEGGQAGYMVVNRVPSGWKIPSWKDETRLWIKKIKQKESR